MLRRLKLFWESYKYRFVPWIAANLNSRSVRNIDASLDKVIPPAQVSSLLIELFQALHENEQLLRSQHHDRTQCPRGNFPQCREQPPTVISRTSGFSVYRAPSLLAGGGTGVFTSGAIPKHHVVGLYPGTIYLPYEPILLQSLANPFIFRCSDGLLIDGFDRRISRAIYRYVSSSSKQVWHVQASPVLHVVIPFPPLKSMSGVAVHSALEYDLEKDAVQRSCSRRDRITPHLPSSDLTWVTDDLQNPLNVGQYVNNQTKEFEANVAYQEYDVDHQFPLELRQYLPNVFYNAELLHQRSLRMVVLVSLREIQAGEELLSSYFTLIH